MALEKVPRKTITATLPGGRVVCLREPGGEDELKAAIEAGSGPAAGVVMDWALTMRCLVSINGEPVDQASLTAQTVRNYFSAQEWIAIKRLMVEGFFLMSVAEEDALEASKRVGVTQG